MRPASFLLPLLLLPLMASAFDAPGRPDIIPEGRRVRPPHPVATLVTVDVQSFASSQCRRYMVAKDDTLASIAKRECGDARCAEEIRLLNSEIRVEELKAGVDIVLPPPAIASESRADSRPGTAAAWVLFEDASDLPRPKPLVAGESATAGEGLRMQQFLLVPRDQLTDFLRVAWSRARKEMPAYVAKSGSFMLTTGVPASDPTMKIETRVTLRDVKDAKLTIDLLERRFDKQGKLLSEKPKALMLPPPPRNAAIQVGLAAIGLSALALASLLARRRQRSACCG